jgi:hypothetical protein
MSKDQRFTNVVWQGQEADLPVILLARMRVEGEAVTSQTQAIKLCVRRYLQMLDQKPQASAAPSKPQQLQFKNQEALDNYKAVIEAYEQNIDPNSPPNYSLISRITGLHRKTVKRHLETYFQNNPFNAEGQEEINNVGF